MYKRFIEIGSFGSIFRKMFKYNELRGGLKRLAKSLKLFGLLNGNSVLCPINMRENVVYSEEELSFMGEGERKNFLYRGSITEKCPSNGKE